jgi:hypothetical protein
MLEAILDDARGRRGHFEKSPVSARRQQADGSQKPEGHENGLTPALTPLTPAGKGFWGPPGVRRNEKTLDFSGFHAWSSFTKAVLYR